MERHITFTSEAGDTVTCSVYDVVDTLSVWYPDAPAEVTDAISELARKVVADRYPETSEEDAALGLSWEWAKLLDLAASAEHLGIADRVGSIEKGKDADIVLWDGDPLDARSRAVWTIIDGETVYTRGF